MGAAAAARRPRSAQAPRPKLKRLPPEARNLKVRPKPRSAARADRPKMTVYRSAAIPQVAGRAAVAVRELPDSGAIVRLTRGRSWIAVLGALLAGIVALNVVSLGLNASAGQVSVQVDALERDNSALRADIAEKLSAEKVQNAATTLGLATPAPGEIGYLTYNDSLLAQAAKVLAGEASTAAASTYSPTSSLSSSSTTSTSSYPSSSSSTSASATSTPSPAPSTTSSAPSSSSTPAPSSAPSSGTSGGGVSAGL